MQNPRKSPLYLRAKSGRRRTRGSSSIVFLLEKQQTETIVIPCPTAARESSGEALLE
jgi:hypothetical protein